MTNSMMIRNVIAVCLIVACQILMDEIGSFSNLKLVYRASIGVMITIGALQLADYIAKLIEKLHKK